MTSAKLSSVHFTPAPDASKDPGLIGYLRLGVGDLMIDGVTLRRRRDGRPVLSYPKRRDGGGRQHAIVRPRDDQARRAIEAAVLEVLGLETTP